MVRQRTAILLHTFDNRGPTWETAVWGSPMRPGRIPTAVAEALESNAELLMIFSENLSGKNTGALIRDYLFEHIEELRAFAPTLPILCQVPLRVIERRLKKTFLLSDVQIKNTADEVWLAYPILLERKIDHVVSVSNIDHMSRIIQLVGALWTDQGHTDIAVSFRPALSMYSPAGSTMKDVVVFEPPAVAGLGPVNPRRLFTVWNNPQTIPAVDSALTLIGA